MYKEYAENPERYERFWSFGTDVYEMGIVDDEFYMSQVGKTKYCIMLGAVASVDKQQVYRYLVSNKHIPHLKRIDHIGDVNAVKSYYHVNQETGIITVRYAPVAPKEQDNEFIENYLSQTFGPHKDFIKQWLAFFVYTNYKKLPTIILNGLRGTGKNLFAELVMSIYPGLSQFWHGREKDFTPEVEKKLLVADESTSDTEAQYRMLKKYSGQDKTVVNKKYMAQYTALNNMSIIILSNSSRPIHVDQTELPTDEMNNQFFVHKMKPIEGPIDTGLPAKLQSYLGHYIRTELLSVYGQIHAKTDCRYSIPVPITDAERDLFDLNKSDLDEEVDKLLDRIAGGPGKMYEEFFKDGYIPKKFISDYYYPRGMTKVDVYRRLKEARLVRSDRLLQRRTPSEIQGAAGTIIGDDRADEGLVYQADQSTDRKCQRRASAEPKRVRETNEFGF